VVRLLKDFSARTDVTPIAWAVAYMDVGDRDRAFEWFGKGVEVHSMFIDEMKVEPMYDGLRSDAREPASTVPWTSPLRNVARSQYLEV
jgi:hypothetical protein